MALFPLTVDANAMNDSMLERLKIDVTTFHAVRPTSAYKPPPRKRRKTSKKTRAKAKEVKASEQGGMESVLRVGVGAQVRLTRNLYDREGEFISLSNFCTS